MQSVAFSPEADSAARRPKFNSDASSIFVDGEAPLGRRSIASLSVTSKVGTMSDNSATVTITDTSGINLGDMVLGVGASDIESCTTTDTNDLFVLAAHGLPLGTPVWLETIVTTTGITAGKRYYVVTPTAGGGSGNFSLAHVPGGTPITLTTDGTATFRAARFVAAITTDASITLNAISMAAATATPLEFVTPPSFVL